MYPIKLGEGTKGENNREDKEKWKSKKKEKSSSDVSYTCFACYFRSPANMACALWVLFDLHCTR